MWKNYFMTAWRNLMRHKGYSIINIGGLAIGLAACILIFLFVRDEMSYDKWLTDSEQLYRLEAAFKDQNGTYRPQAISPGRLMPEINKAFESELVASSRLYREGHVFVMDSEVAVDVVQYVDQGFFEIFDLPVVAGDRNAVLADNTSVAITERMASKYFGDSDPIGQIMKLDDVDYDFKVVAVLRDLPENTHMTGDFFALFDPERFVDRPWIATMWLSSNVYNYMKVQDAVAAERIEDGMAAFVDRVVDRTTLSDTTTVPSELLRFNMMPVEDIHLYSHGRFQLQAGGDIRVVYSFSLIALLILAIACINFVNLATARSSLRAREIALRKVVGAERSQLIHQFLGEAVIMVAIAMMLALTLVELLLPWFSEFVAKILSLDYATDPQAMAMLGGMLLVVGLGAGVHPAMHITRYHPAQVLHSGKVQASNSKFRVVLVTIQFTISIALIVSTLIVYAQTKFVSDQDLGFDHSNKYQIGSMTYQSVEPAAKSIQTEIDRLPGVKSTAFNARSLPLSGYWDSNFTMPEKTGTQPYRLEQVPVSETYLDMMKVPVLAGRGFSEDRLSDRIHEDEEGFTRANVLVNEATVQYLGYASNEAALGGTLDFKFSFNNSVGRYTIVGVVGNMHMRSMREKIDPAVFHTGGGEQTLTIDIASDRVEETLAAIDVIWKKQVPSFPMFSSFMDAEFDDRYQADKQRLEMFAYFAGFAVLVSCLGLWGLSSFTAEQKTKEIGVRKVYGASVPSIVTLLLWQFSKPILVANIIAWPIAWFAMQDWLQGFVYRIELNLMPFLVAGIGALLVAWITVGLHAVRVAGRNPVHALRYE